MRLAGKPQSTKNYVLATRVSGKKTKVRILGKSMKQYKSRFERTLEYTAALAVSIAGMLLIITLSLLSKLLNNQQY